MPIFSIETATVDDQKSNLLTCLESLHSVLVGLISFTANRKHQRNVRAGGQEQRGSGAPHSPPQYGGSPPSQQERNFEVGGEQQQRVVTVNNNLVGVMTNLCI